jgi:hypothetical protein
VLKGARKWPVFTLTSMAFAAVILVSAFAMSQGDTPSLAEPAPTPSLNSGANICRIVDRVAVDNGLPMAFFTRLIWQESKFDPVAHSSAGAQGIAQFMPLTAASRGLANPFEPITALDESASYLHELRNTFGNLGLAAAAYNAGPYRVSRWLEHKTSLPGETIDYVQIVTGRSVWDWSGPDAAKRESLGFPQGIGCDEVARLLTLPPATQAAPANSPWKPWGVQLAGAWTQGPVLAAFELASPVCGNIGGSPAAHLACAPRVCPCAHVCGPHWRGFGARSQPLVQSAQSRGLRL